MEPRCNHLGNGVTPVSSRTQLPPQWSPGVITWETPFVIAFIRSPNAPQWSPGVITWETLRRRGLAPRRLVASMEPRCNHLGNSSPKQWANCRRLSVAFAGCGTDGEEAATHGGYRYGSAAYQAFLLRGLTWASSATGPFATKREEIHPGVASGRP